MSESNCAAPAEKPSGSPAVHVRPSCHEQRTGLQQVTGGPVREVGAAGDPHGAGPRVDAGAARVPRGVERDGRAHDAVRAQLAERHAARAHEEPTDDRLGDPLAGAVRGQRGRPLEAHHADLGVRELVGGDVQRGVGAVGEREAQAPQVRGRRVRAGDRFLRAASCRHSGQGGTARGGACHPDVTVRAGRAARRPSPSAGRARARRPRRRAPSCARPGASPIPRRP